MSKIKRISVNNFLQIKDLNFEPGDVTVLSGHNDGGKTSVISALANLFNGGSEAELIRRGADQAEIVLLLDDDQEFRKVIKPNGAELIHKIKGKKQKAPQTKLKAMIDKYAIDPDRLLRADPKERVDYVLSLMPLELDEEVVKELAGVEHVGEGHALEVLAALRATLYEKRTKTHGALMDKIAHLTELRKALPAGKFEDVTPRLVAAREQLEAIREKVRTDTEAAREKRRNEIDQCDKSLAEFDAKCKAELQAAIDELKKQYDTKYSEAANRAQDQIDDIRAQYEQTVHDVQEKSAEPIATLTADIATLEERQTQQVRNQSLFELVENETLHAEDLQNEWVSLDARIKHLDTYKQSLASQLPIPGIEVKDGDLVIEGTVWRHVNTAKRMDVVFRLAEHAFADIEFVFMDRFEAYDPENKKAFIERALQSPKQVLVAEVASGPLTVTPYRAGQPSFTEQLERDADRLVASQYDDDDEPFEDDRYADDRFDEEYDDSFEHESEEDEFDPFEDELL